MEYLSAFSPNAGNYGPEKLRIRTLLKKSYHLKKLNRYTHWSNILSLLKTVEIHFLTFVMRLKKIWRTFVSYCFVFAVWAISTSLCISGFISFTLYSFHLTGKTVFFFQLHWKWINPCPIILLKLVTALLRGFLRKKGHGP